MGFVNSCRKEKSKSVTKTIYAPRQATSRTLAITRGLLLNSVTGQHCHYTAYQNVTTTVSMVYINSMGVMP